MLPCHCPADSLTCAVPSILNCPALVSHFLSLAGCTMLPCCACRATCRARTSCGGWRWWRRRWACRPARTPSLVRGGRAVVSRPSRMLSRGGGMAATARVCPCVRPGCGCRCMPRASCHPGRTWPFPHPLPPRRLLPQGRERRRAQALLHRRGAADRPLGAHAGAPAHPRMWRWAAHVAPGPACGAAVRPSHVRGHPGAPAHPAAHSAAPPCCCPAPCRTNRPRGWTAPQACTSCSCCATWQVLCLAGWAHLPACYGNAGQLACSMLCGAAAGEATS